MNFNLYQLTSKTTAIYPRECAIEYCALGLAGEAGEVANKIAKVLRDQNGKFTDENIDAISGELGDVLWMISQLATELGLVLGDIANENIDKLQDRQQRGVIGGSGDKR